MSVSDGRIRDRAHPWPLLPLVLLQGLHCDAQELTHIATQDGAGRMTLSADPAELFLAFGSHSYAPDAFHSAAGEDLTGQVFWGDPIPIALFQGLSAREAVFPDALAGKEIQVRRDSLVDPHIPQAVGRELSWVELESIAFPLDFQKVLVASPHDPSPGFVYQNGQWLTTWPSRDLPEGAKGELNPPSMPISRTAAVECRIRARSRTDARATEGRFLAVDLPEAGMGLLELAPTTAPSFPSLPAAPSRCAPSTGAVACQRSEIASRPAS